MKKILMGTAFLSITGIAITSSQFSCTKGSSQSSTTGLTQLNKILYTKKTYNPNTGVVQSQSLWVSNLDGSNQKEIPISLTTGQNFFGAGKLTPDGKTVVVEISTPTSVVGGYQRYKSDLYTLSVDGSNLKKILDFGDISGGYSILGAY
jgi:hypothetical protein